MHNRVILKKVFTANVARMLKNLIPQLKQFSTGENIYDERQVLIIRVFVFIVFK
jgi:hypothetical protein